MALTLTSNGVTGLVHGKKRQPYKSPEGATYVSNAEQNLGKLHITPLGA